MIMTVIGTMIMMMIPIMKIYDRHDHTKTIDRYQ